LPLGLPEAASPEQAPVDERLEASGKEQQEALDNLWLVRGGELVVELVVVSTPHNDESLLDDVLRNSADEVLPGFLGQALACCPSLVHRLEADEEVDDIDDEEESEEDDEDSGIPEQRLRGIRGTADVAATPPPPAGDDDIGLDFVNTDTSEDRLFLGDRNGLVLSSPLLLVLVPPVLALLPWRMLDSSSLLQLLLMAPPLLLMRNDSRTDSKADDADDGDDDDTLPLLGIGEDDADTDMDADVDDEDCSFLLLSSSSSLSSSPTCNVVGGGGDNGNGCGGSCEVLFEELQHSHLCRDLF
jgi:hypothetical protein